MHFDFTVHPSFSTIVADRLSSSYAAVSGLDKAKDICYTVRIIAQGRAYGSCEEECRREYTAFEYAPLLVVRDCSVCVFGAVFSTLRSDLVFGRRLGFPAFLSSRVTGLGSGYGVRCRFGRNAFSDA